MRALATTLLGLLLLPASAGLAFTLFDFVAGLQSEPALDPRFLWFLTGGMVWLLIFLFLNRPVRLYILSHELCHLLAAWVSGIRGGHLDIHADGGSVEVARSTLWIALAPYFIPLYSLVILIGFGLAGRWMDPQHLNRALPFSLGLTWSFHVTFTLYALSQPQSDLRPYGVPGSLSIILFMNLLLLTLAAAVSHPLPFSGEVHLLWQRWTTCYAWSLEQIFFLKNTIFRG